MSEEIEEVFQQLAKISEFYRFSGLKIVEKTKSVIKARLYLSEELFIQIYANVKKEKRSYSLILNERRIYGKDYLWGQWHLHPFEKPDEHNESDYSRREISIDDFVEKSIFLASEELKII